jgi:NAD-dependent SIR2 family protein deacetylase
MAYLFWKDGRIQTPSCSSCGSSMTSEEQEAVNSQFKIRNIYIKCYSCGEKKLVGKFEHLDGHNFKKV